MMLIRGSLEQKVRKLVAENHRLTLRVGSLNLLNLQLTGQNVELAKSLQREQQAHGVSPLG